MSVSLSVKVKSVVKRPHSPARATRLFSPSKNSFQMRCGKTALWSLRSFMLIVRAAASFAAKDLDGLPFELDDDFDVGFVSVKEGQYGEKRWRRSSLSWSDAWRKSLLVVRTNGCSWSLPSCGI